MIQYKYNTNTFKLGSNTINIIQGLQTWCKYPTIWSPHPTNTPSPFNHLTYLWHTTDCTPLTQSSRSTEQRYVYIWDFTSRVILALRSYPCEMVYVSWMNGGWLRVHRELWVGGGWRTQPCQFFHGKNLPPPASGQSFAEGHPVKRYFVLNRTPGNNFSENIWIFNHGTVCIKEVGSCTLQCVFGHAWPLYLSPSMRKTLRKKRQLCHGLQGDQIDNLQTKSTRKLQGTILQLW